MRLLTTLAAVVSLAAVAAAVDPPAAPVKAVRRDAPYRAYWLTGSEGAEYPTLLVTRGPVEDLAGHRAWSALPLDNMAFTFVTYAKDSFWSAPFKGVQRVGEVDPKRKSVVLDGNIFSYETCPLRHLVRMLENPNGTIPVHRREKPLAGAEMTAKAFRLLLEEQLKAEK